jgi:transcription elongation GreA/GreB family factor
LLRLDLHPKSTVVHGFAGGFWEPGPLAARALKRHAGVVDKPLIIAAIVETLTRQLHETAEALAHAQASATDEEARPENKYDTRALEMSYIAAAQTERTEGLRRTLTQYHFWRPEPHLQVIAAGALVHLEGERVPALVFVTPYAPGMIVQVQGVQVQVVTLQSPLGAMLLGKQAGDIATFLAGGLAREFEVVAVDP